MTATDKVQLITKQEIEDCLFDPNNLDRYDKAIEKYFGDDSDGALEVLRVIDQDPIARLDPPSVSFAAGFVAALAVLENRNRNDNGADS